MIFFKRKIFERFQIQSDFTKLSAMLTMYNYWNNIMNLHCLCNDPFLSLYGSVGGERGDEVGRKQWCFLMYSHKHRDVGLLFLAELWKYLAYDVEPCAESGVLCRHRNGKRCWIRNCTFLLLDVLHMFYPHLGMGKCNVICCFIHITETPWEVTRGMTWIITEMVKSLTNIFLSVMWIKQKITLQFSLPRFI
jgi:hypothetical protein